MAQAEDSVEAIEIVKTKSEEDLHFRYMGKASGRQFVINVQLDARGDSGELLKPVEHFFMVAKVLGLVVKRLATEPFAGSH